MNDADVLDRAARRGRPRDPSELYRSALRAAGRAEPYPAATGRRVRRTMGLLAVGGAIAVACIAFVVVDDRTRPDTLVTNAEPPSQEAPGTSVPPTEPPPTAGPTAPATTAPALTCGSSLPFAFDIVGFTGPLAGAAPQNPFPVHDGQLVQHWTRDEQTFEVRWPPNPAPTEAERSIRSETPSTGFTSSQMLAAYGYTDQCAGLSVRAFAPTWDGAEALSTQLQSFVSDTIREHTRATVPLVRERRAVDAPPVIIGCRGADGALMRATTVRPVTVARHADSPDGALRAFLDADDAARTYADVGYVDFVTPDGVHHFGYTVGAADDVPVLIDVAQTALGWTATRVTASGC